MTCAHVGLLGPCFKTGRIEKRSFTSDLNINENQALLDNQTKTHSLGSKALIIVKEIAQISLALIF